MPPARKVVLHMMTTLDGCVSGPNGELDWLFAFRDEERGKYLLEFYKGMDAILVGRTTYLAMAGFWPKAEENESASDLDREFASVMNSTPKYVFSKTLGSVEWSNSRLARGDAPTAFRELKARPGRDMVLAGGLSTAKSFMEMGLVDEYRLVVHPVVLGIGRRLFEGLGAKLSLKLLEAKTFGDGVVAFRYAND